MARGSPKAPLSLKARALQCLAQREHSRLELRRKLIAHAARRVAREAAEDAGAGSAADSASFSRRAAPEAGVDDEIDALLDWLCAHGHLDEARFVEARVRVREVRHGNLRIRHELGLHGLQLAPAEEQALVDSELARARQVWARKFDGPPRDAVERSRQMRFLVGRGFSADVIRRLLRSRAKD